MINGYKVRSDYNRKHGKTTTYVNLMNFTCAIPDCNGGGDIEGHHIIPISKGGADAFWNMISLCRQCHRHKGLHSKWDKWDVELYTWKCQHELARFGFYLDEKEDNFRENLKKAVRICASEDIKSQIKMVIPGELEDIK